jgi:hypothetical protein
MTNAIQALIDKLRARLALLRAMLERDGRLHAVCGCPG